MKAAARPVKVVLFLDAEEEAMLKRVQRTLRDRSRTSATRAEALRRGIYALRYCQRWEYDPSNDPDNDDDRHTDGGP